MTIKIFLVVLERSTDRRPSEGGSGSESLPLNFNRLLSSFFFSSFFSLMCLVVVLQIREAFYGKGHALVAPSLQMQAHLQFTEGNEERASQLLKECLSIQEDRWVCRCRGPSCFCFVFRRVCGEKG